MKILLINQTFFPDLAATAQYLTDFALHLVTSGHDVTVLTGRRSYLFPGRLYRERETFHGIKVIRVWSFPFNRRLKILRILDAFLLNLSFAWHLLGLSNFDQFVAMTTPPLVGWIASLFAKWRHSQFIYWVMDINPDQAVQAGWIRQDGFQARLTGRMLSDILKRSDKTIVLDRFMKKNVLSKGALPESVEIIPPWAPEEIIDSISHEKSSFRTQHQLDEKFVVMYSGNLSICHPLNTVLEAALTLKSDRSIQFLFIGGGARLPEILEFKEKNELSNVTYLNYQERDQLKDSLSAADLHVVAMGNSYTGIVHPSKIYGILAVGRPFIFIGPVESPIGELVQETGVGRQIEHGDIAGFIRTIHETRQLSLEEKREIARKSIDLKNTRFSQEKLTQKLMELFCHGALSR